MDHNDQFIEACYACAAACEKNATACLFEEDIKSVRKVIMLSRECSAICLATAKILSVGVDRFQMLFRACEEMCMACAKECGDHAQLPSCKKCAEACRRCAELCRKIKPELVN